MKVYVWLRSKSVNHTVIKYVSIKPPNYFYQLLIIMLIIMAHHCEHLFSASAGKFWSKINLKVILDYVNNMLY